VYFVASITYKSTFIINTSLNFKKCKSPLDIDEEEAEEDVYETDTDDDPSQSNGSDAYEDEEGFVSDSDESDNVNENLDGFDVSDDEDDEGEEACTDIPYAGPQIIDKKKRANTDNKKRTRIIKLALQNYKLTSTSAAIMFVTYTGRIITFCTSGNYVRFLRTVAEGVQAQEKSLIRLNMVRMIHRFNGSALPLSFDDIRKVATDLELDAKLVAETERRFKVEVRYGRMLEAKDTMHAVITEAFKSLCSSFAEAPPPTVDEDVSEAGSVPSENVTQPQNVINGGCVLSALPALPSLIEIAKAFADNDRSSFDSFSSAFLEWLGRDAANHHHYPDSIPQDIIDPHSGLTLKNPRWLDVRRGLITGSVIGELLGHGFGSVRTAVEKFVRGFDYESTSDFAKGMMLWGTCNEPTARGVLLHQLKSKFPNHSLDIITKGIYISNNHHYLGYSPDGILILNGERIGVEIKCPAHNNYRLRPPAQRGGPLYPLEDYPDGHKGHCPIKYWYQVQLGMYVMSVRRFCFFVWTPFETYMEWIVFANEHMNTDIIPRLQGMYQNDILKYLYAQLSEPLPVAANDGDAHNSINNNSNNNNNNTRGSSESNVDQSA
jgi:hypothetical protein